MQSLVSGWEAFEPRKVGEEFMFDQPALTAKLLGWIHKMNAEMIGKVRFYSLSLN